MEVASIIPQPRYVWHLSTWLLQSFSTAAGVVTWPNMISTLPPAAWGKQAAYLPSTVPCAMLDSSPGCEMLMLLSRHLKTSEGLYTPESGMWLSGPALLGTGILNLLGKGRSRTWDSSATGFLQFTFVCHAWKPLHIELHLYSVLVLGSWTVFQKYWLFV